MNNNLTSLLDFPTAANAYHFTASRSDAELILERNKAWYGPHHETSVTPYTNVSIMATLSGIATSQPPKTSDVQAQLSLKSPALARL